MYCPPQYVCDPNPNCVPPNCVQAFPDVRATLEKICSGELILTEDEFDALIVEFENAKSFLYHLQ